MNLHTKQGVLTAAAALLVLALSAGSARAHGPSCSIETLSGDYGFTITGQILGGPTAGPVAGVAMTYFDGDGNLTQLDHVVHNGNPPAVDWRPATGNYSLNPDCTGTMEIDFADGSPSLHLSIVVVRLGREIRTVVSNPGTALTSIGIKQDSAL